MVLSFIEATTEIMVCYLYLKKAMCPSIHNALINLESIDIR